MAPGVADQVLDWNAAHPFNEAAGGIRVEFTCDDGSQLTCTTRSLAWRAGNTAWIKLVGITGAVRLDRVKPL